MLDQAIETQRISLNNYQIAVLLPCRNEALTIAQVIKDFKASLPDAKIYVYDNCSTDNTATEAKKAGAIVRYENNPGKGNVVRRMFADIEADIYVLADGDNTYESAAVERLINRLLIEYLDMVVGMRRPHANKTRAYRPGHRGGNLFLTGFVKFLFGAQLKDMLSGYRIFSRRFVKSFPALSSGFEIETEFTIHALELKMPFVEEPTIYGERPPGSSSKLRTFTDGWRILGTALLMFKEVRPLLLFGIICLILALTSVILAIPIIETFVVTGLVPRFPTAILAASLMILAFLSLTCGLILDSVARGRQEVKRLAYLAHPLAKLE
ncbi:MAG: glycosyltransferase family 2 protein [Xenococcaceae cyanobacterium MO_234.B1]|nr:glycosyltransferase family 2 protein [Xenococcaceae cyanobacterium MO_234.B1]